jgi:hypothetical protein
MSYDPVRGERGQVTSCPRFHLGTADVVRLSKIANYLIDNLCVLMLSQLERRGQGENGRAAEPVPNWESRVSAVKSTMLSLRQPA